MQLNVATASAEIPVTDSDKKPLTSPDQVNSLCSLYGHITTPFLGTNTPYSMGCFTVIFQQEDLGIQAL